MGKMFRGALFVVPMVAGLMVAGCGEEDEETSGPDLDVYDGMVELYDNSINSGETLTLTADSTYVLMEKVFVEEGATINIPAGTVIKGEPGTGLDASALIICMGATINANGTASNPIIMTALSDDVTDATDMDPTARGLWGGLIVLGKAPTTVGTGAIEGIGTDVRGAYGGSDAADNSGTIRYVSIRHGGSEIGEGNEINGLTMGGVGSGTTIEYVEVYNNNDDGFEFFGGTVNTKYLIAAGCADDSYDWDEGFKGKGQFWVVVQGTDGADRAIEADGLDGDSRGAGGGKESQPTIYNATFVGTGVSSGDVDNVAFKLREETGAFIHNSIITGFTGKPSDDGTKAPVVDIDDSKPTSGGNYPSLQIQSGGLIISNNLFYGFTNNYTDPSALIAFDTEPINAAFVVDSLAAWNTWDQDPGVSRTSLAPSNTVSVTPKTPTDAFFANVSYLGAFDPSGANWLSGGWSFFGTQM